MGKRFKDYHLLILLLIISIISVYFMPAMVNRLVFLIILMAAFRTKHDYVFLVWFFIINDAPGRLFSGATFDVLQRIPLYPVTGGISIGFEEFFLFLYLFKYLSLKNPPKFIFKKEFAWFLTFGLFTAGWSYLLGMSFDNMIRTFRIFLPWSLVFILPTYVYNRHILLRSSLLIFPVVFIAFLTQIYTYITGNYLESHLRGLEPFYLGTGDGGFAIRTYSAVIITFFSIIQAFYYVSNRQSGINPNYLTLVIFIGFFTIFLSGTRGWIIALALFLLGGLFLLGFFRGIGKWIRLVALSAVVFWIAVALFPVVQKQLYKTLQRLTTLESLVAGDITAGGTLQRLNVRGPKVMSKFWESPLAGWGFSNGYYDYTDVHVGQQDVLLNVGIVGYLFINGLFVLLCMKIWKLSRKRETKRSLGKALLVYVLGLMAVYVIHSSSTRFWGYHLTIHKILFFSFFFAAVNAALLHNIPSGKNFSSKIKRTAKDKCA